MIVLDASALVDVLVNADLGPRVQRHLSLEGAVVAPELIYVEAASAIWRMARAGELDDGETALALDSIQTFDLMPMGHRELMTRAWRFREHVRLSDAFYLACSLEVGGPLLSTDARLARGHHGVPVTLVT